MLVKPRVPRPDDPNRIDAQRLLDALKQAKKLQRAYSLPKWTEVLRKLRDRVGDERFRQALDWYCAHVGERYVPQAYSAQGFADKFVGIEEAQARSAPLACTDVSEEAQDIARRLRLRLLWPQNTAAQLPALAQLCLERYRAFLRALRRDTPTKLKGHPKEESFARFARELRLSLLPAPAQLVEAWLEDVQARLSYRAQQSPMSPLSLSIYTLDTNGAALDALGYDAALRWFGTASRWDEFKQSLGR